MTGPAGSVRPKQLLPLLLTLALLASAAAAPAALAQQVAPKNGSAAEIRVVPKDAAVPGAGSAGGLQPPGLHDLSDEEAEALVTFVNGNTLFTLYHELGHALVDRLQLPVLGREEDAVDGLAAWLMVPEVEDAVAEELLMAAADGHALAAWYGEEDELAFWDEHSMDLQRFAAIYCLLYGSDPEGFAELADELEMPEGDRERCPATYAQVEAGWLAVLAAHLRDDAAREPSPMPAGAGRVTVTFADPVPGLDPLLRTLVEEPGLMQAAADALAGMIALPGDIPVAFKACGEANAFYDPGSGEVEMCYELVAWFLELYFRDLADSRQEAAGQ